MFLKYLYSILIHLYFINFPVTTFLQNQIIINCNVSSPSVLQVVRIEFNISDQVFVGYLGCRSLNVRTSRGSQHLFFIIVHLVYYKLKLAKTFPKRNNATH